jgi:hypothetical protein
MSDGTTGIQRSPGILTLDTTTNTTKFNISLDIPKQVLILQSVRVEYDTAAHALAAGVIYVEFPWLSANQLIDGNPNHVYLPIFLDNAVVTLQQTLQLPVYMTHHIPQVFTMNVRDGPGAGFALAAGGFTRITLSFQLSYGHV